MSTILQITPYYPPHLGGLERVVENLASGLGRRHDVKVLTTTIGARSEPGRTRHGTVTVRRHRSVEVAHTPLAPGMLLSLLRTPRSAIVHLHSAHAVLPEMVALTARLRGQRFLVHFHLDVDATGIFGRFLPAYKKHIFGRVLRAAAGVIVLTEAQAAFVRVMYRIPAERVFVVPNGVGGAYFMPVRPARRPTAGLLRILYVGRLSPQKNVGRLIAALPLLREPVHLTIVGDGEQREALKQQAAGAVSATVTFAGPLFESDLVRSYAEADVFVLPSDKEGMPLAALEAMAAALPVVATDVPGNRELLGGVALLARPEPIALAAALDSVAADPSLGQELSRRSLAAARTYSWDSVVRRIEDVYAEAFS